MKATDRTSVTEIIIDKSTVDPEKVQLSSVPTMSLVCQQTETLLKCVETMKPTASPTETDSAALTHCRVPHSRRWFEF